MRDTRAAGNVGGRLRRLGRADRPPAGGRIGLGLVLRRHGRDARHDGRDPLRLVEQAAGKAQHREHGRDDGAGRAVEAVIETRPRTPVRDGECLAPRGDSRPGPPQHDAQHRHRQQREAGDGDDGLADVARKQVAVQVEQRGHQQGPGQARLAPHALARDGKAGRVDHDLTRAVRRERPASARRRQAVPRDGHFAGALRQRQLRGAAVRGIGGEPVDDAADVGRPQGRVRRRLEQRGVQHAVEFMHPRERAAGEARQREQAAEDERQGQVHAPEQGAEGTAYHRAAVRSGSAR
jgi:hypothetical protein